MSERIIGLSVQTLVWLCFLVLYFKGGSLLALPNLIIFLVLLAALFCYFYEYLFHSKTFNLLTQKRKVVQSKYDIINRLTKSKPYVEISTKAFHYDNDKEVVTSEKFYLYEFQDVKDQSQVKYIDVYLSDDHTKDQLIVLDLSINVIFSDKSCLEELDASVNKIKNDTSFLDKYYEVKTKYILKNLQQQENTFIYKENEASFLFNPYVFMFSYFILVGEFYKMLVEKNIFAMSFDLQKQVNKFSNDKKLGKIIDYDSFFETEEERMDLLNGFNDPQSGANLTPENANTNLLEQSIENNMIASPNFDDTPQIEVKVDNITAPNAVMTPEGRDARSKAQNQPATGDGKYLIDNYDPIFDAKPINSLESQSQPTPSQPQVGNISDPSYINVQGDNVISPSNLTGDPSTIPYTKQKPNYQKPQMSKEDLGASKSGNPSNFSLADSKNEALDSTEKKDTNNSRTATDKKDKSNVTGDESVEVSNLTTSREEESKYDDDEEDVDYSGVVNENLMDMFDINQQKDKKKVKKVKKSVHGDKSSTKDKAKEKSSTSGIKLKEPTRTSKIPKK